MAIVNREHWRLRLVELIEHLGLSQTALASAIGMDASYVSRLLYEPGKKARKNLGPEVMAKVRDAYDLSAGWFDLPMGAQMPPRPPPTDAPTPDEMSVREEPATYQIDPWLSEAHDILKSLPAADRRAAVINLRAYVQNIGPPRGGADIREALIQDERAAQAKQAKRAAARHDKQSNE